MGNARFMELKIALGNENKISFSNGHQWPIIKAATAGQINK